VLLLVWVLYFFGWGGEQKRLTKNGKDLVREVLAHHHPQNKNHQGKSQECEITGKNRTGSPRGNLKLRERIRRGHHPLAFKTKKKRDRTLNRKDITQDGNNRTKKSKNYQSV